MSRRISHWVIGTLLCFISASCSILPPSTTSITSYPTTQLIVINVPSTQPPKRAAIGMGGKPYVSQGNYAVPFSTHDTLTQLMDDYSLSPVEGWPLAALGMYCQVVAVPAHTTPTALLETLNADARIAFAQPLHTFTTRAQVDRAEPRAYNDPYFTAQFEGFHHQVNAIHQRITGNDVTIAVVDTGADIEHTDLHHPVRTARNFVDTHQEQFLRDTHGTAIAGIIAATPNNHTGIVGVAPDASLMMLKACWYADRAHSDAAHCNSFTLAKALLFALEANADIINLSLSGPDDPLLETIIDTLIARGIIVVAAAHHDPQHNFPAKLPHVISTDTTRSPSLSREQLSTAPNNRYDFYSGNSIASAYISGISALLLQADPHNTRESIQRILSGTADDPQCIATPFLMTGNTSSCVPQ